MKLWTLTTDDDHGITTELHATAESVDQSLTVRYGTSDRDELTANIVLYVEEWDTDELPVAVASPDL